MIFKHLAFIKYLHITKTGLFNEFFGQHVCRIRRILPFKLIIRLSSNFPDAISSISSSNVFQVWTTIQENILHYLSNSLVLPLVMRSNRSILKYFVTYETAVTNLNFDGSNGTATLEKTKHGCWFLTEVLGKVIPNLDALEACQDYLQELGAKHQAHGVRKEHLDLLALVYCASVRGVVATQGT